MFNYKKWHRYVVLLALILITVVGYNWLNKLDISSRVAKQRIIAEHISDEILSEKIKTLRNLGVLGKNIASSKTDVCYLGHNDGGFMTMSWYQACYLRYVEGFTTPFNINILLEKMGFVPELRSWRYDCELYDNISQNNNYIIGIFFQPDATAKEKNSTCMIPDQSNGGMHEPVKIKSIKSFDPKSIDSSEKHIWVEMDVPYYNEKLGCSAVGILCPSPRSAPINGF